MTLHEKIYRKQMVILSLKSYGWSIDNQRHLIALCNLDVAFLHHCVRTYRGKLSITKRIERIRSGNHIY